jgi:hypothetical protein
MGVPVDPMEDGALVLFEDCKSNKALLFSVGKLIRSMYL